MKLKDWAVQSLSASKCDAKPKKKKGKSFRKTTLIKIELPLLV